MASALRLPRTLDEFLEWERRQEERWEFLDGQLRLMAGATGDHAQIGANIVAALVPRLRGSGCQTFASDLKLLVRAMGKSFYPDVMVRCGRPVGQDDTVEDPVVLFEVLSKGTAEYDLTTKRKAYQTIPTLRMFAFVSQLRPHVLLYLRGEDGRWDDVEVEGLGGVLRLDAIGAELPLAELYENTTVAEAARGADPSVSPAR